MTAWSSPEILHERLKREWDRGCILAHLLGGEPLFPYRIPLRGPVSRDLVDHYGAVREWIKQLVPLETTDVRLAWRDFRHPLLGRNRVPIALVVKTPEAALRALQKTAEWRAVRNAVQLMEDEMPDLLAWATTHPLEVLEWRDVWPRLLTVVGWVRAHPQSGMYLRQIDAPGIDTKFIERHRRILMDILDQVLDPAHIDEQATGTSSFEARYGFRQKPQPVRFRLLDPGQSIQGMTDLTIASEEFGRLKLSIREVFIMENEIEFLAFPPRFHSLAVFGSGYGLKRFQNAHWFRDLPVYYWGDIDTHGLAILDELRLYIAHAQSFLMDEDTLLRHQVFWDREERPKTRDLARLTPQERDLYEGLRSHRWGNRVRLEQERIPMGWVLKKLSESLRD